MITRATGADGGSHRSETFGPLPIKVGASSHVRFSSITSEPDTHVESSQPLGHIDGVRNTATTPDSGGESRCLPRTTVSDSPDG